MNEYFVFVGLNASLDDVRNGLGHHRNAVDDWTNAQAQVATFEEVRISSKSFPKVSRLTCAVVGDMRQMGFGIKRDGLVARVSASHVALSTVNAQVL